jgi:hypothetical protein
MATSKKLTAGLARGFYNCPETPKPVDLSVKGEVCVHGFFVSSTNMLMTFLPRSLTG